jgi:hypothetical protein
MASTYRQVQEFISQCLKFSEDLHLSHTEIDDMVRKATNMLMTRTLAGTGGRNSFIGDEINRMRFIVILELVMTPRGWPLLDRPSGRSRDGYPQGVQCG